MDNRSPVITIDGLSATGKSTLAQNLSFHLGWPVLFSGMLYRYVAYLVMTGCMDEIESYPILKTTSELFTKLTNIRCFRTSTGTWQTMVCDTPLAVNLQSEDIAAKAADLARNQSLRDMLLPVQRAYRIQPGLVAEGRDMASVVFPDACLKIFLVAQASTRASRRHEELQGNDNYVNMQHISSVMSKRDTQDRDRTLQTLQSHPDTMVIDTSVMAIDDVVNQVLSDPRMSAIQGFD
ncbi:MAG: (d)CMP kinase [Pseudomonadota bacterium]|nr:(d)CMP kinase [Pseudomonadota bacterium]